MQDNVKMAVQNYPGLFTIDVEDYYHIIGVRGTPPISAWDSISPRVEIGLTRLFEHLAEHNAKATCFFLGYIARRFPDLVKRAHSLGHEIASHGMYHQEVFKQSPEAFIEDANTSKKILEDTAGVEVKGWRSAGFTIDQNCKWIFDILSQIGYRYDSSLIPNRSKHRFLPNLRNSPFLVETSHGKMVEFPMSVGKMLNHSVCMFGGGYLRFFPLGLISSQADKLLQTKPLMIYIHPRELDKEHPRLKMNPFRYFKSYINLDSVPGKIENLLGKTTYITLDEYYHHYYRCIEDR